MSKSITPKVIQLATWRQRSSTKSVKPAVKHADPLGWKEGDSFVAIEAMESYRLYGVRRGDYLMCFETDDVERGDLAALDYGMGYLHYGVFDFDVCYFYIGGGSYHRSKAQLLGRIVEIQRNGKRIEPKIPLRAIHPTAQVYQFKQRA